MILLSAPVSEALAQQNENQTKMTFSYVNHPVIVEQILPILTRAYSRLGIEVEFVEQPSKRNLRLASSGMTNGEAAYSDLLISLYPNLMLVGPDFVESIFVLLCHRTSPCEEEVLFDPEQTLVLTDASHDGLNVIYRRKLVANIYSINHLKQIPRLVDGRRLAYGIYVTTNNDTSLAAFPDLTHIELFRTKTHHVLNDEFKSLAPKVAEAIRLEMESVR